MFLRRAGRRMFVASATLTVAGGFLIASSTLGGQLPLGIGVGVVLLAAVLGVAFRLALPKLVAAQLTGERYARVHRRELIAGWVLTGFAGALLVAGLVLLFVNLLVGAIFAGIGALYLWYRLFELRDIYRG